MEKLPSNRTWGGEKNFREQSFQPANFLKILSWNIYMLPHLSLIHRNRKRAALIAENLKKSDYDILLFQEAFDWKARRIIRRQLESQYPFMYGPANNSILSLRTNSGVWILSKIPLRKIDEIIYTSKTGLDAYARKGAAMFEGNLNGQKFQLVGTHLQANSTDLVRLQQCSEIYNSLLEKYYERNTPQIVCGDFNISTDDLVNYELMLKTLRVKNGLFEGGNDVSYDEIGNQLAKRKNGQKYRIDHVLVRNSKLIRTINRKISIIRHRTEDFITELSDHYGVEAILDFQDGLNYSPIYMK
jgi:endonuclease/exonuclease/phosphatase family metal-dependent hydrolase